LKAESYVLNRHSLLFFPARVSDARLTCEMVEYPRLP
jgi:hypothetical protein